MMCTMRIRRWKFGAWVYTKIISNTGYAAILIPSLCNEEPYFLPPIFGSSLWPLRIRCVQCRLPSMNIGFFRLDPPCPLEHLPEKIQRAIHRYTNVGCDEVVAIKLLCLAWKCVEAIEKNDYDEEAEGEPGAVRLEARFEDERIAADALSTQSLMKSYVCNRNGNPGQECRDCRKILEPLEDGLRPRGAGHVRQQGDAGSKADAIVWDAPISQVLAWSSNGMMCLTF